MSTQPIPISETEGPLLDPRGPRFAAGINSLLLITAIALGPGWSFIPLVIQLLAFASGAVLGMRFQPWGRIYRVLVAPRLAPPTKMEDDRPPRFAQCMGLGFTVLGALGTLFSLPMLFYVAVGLVLLASLLNVLFDFCMGCQTYLLGKRLFGKQTSPGIALR
ncbi:DUF4395 domain-containing protein [Propionibacterium sp.]|uniref:DUF4395 domain-containing protein n=1 Tax=Propionibacterium sp. TaxID=1977903 RepID=UPI0039EB9348